MRMGLTRCSIEANRSVVEFRRSGLIFTFASITDSVVKKLRKFDGKLMQQGNASWFSDSGPARDSVCPIPKSALRAVLSGLRGRI